LFFISRQEILSAYGKERLDRTRKISSYRAGLATGIQVPNKRWPQFELQVLRESVSSVSVHENEAFTKEENTNESRAQGLQNKAERQESSGEYKEKIRNESNQSNSTAKDANNETKTTQKLSQSQVIVCSSFSITKEGVGSEFITRFGIQNTNMSNINNFTFILK
jgi:hypothetical protein